MAEQVTLNVNVETGEAVKNLGDLEKATKGVSKSTQQAAKSADTLEGRFDQLNKEIKEGPVNIRKMNKQIQEYQAIALEAGRTSPLGKRAIQEAATLKDRYNDITAEVNRLANDGVKLQAALDLGTTITAGYTAFQGALALSGVESEKLQETLIKLQAAQSLLVGVETIRRNLEKESTLVLMAKNTQEKASIALTKIKTFVTSGATSATKLLRIAMLSLPFVAIGAAIIALVSNFKEIMKSMGFFNQRAELMKQTMDAFKTGSEDATKKVMEMKATFKLAEKGVLDKKEALDKYNKEFGKTLGKAEDLNEAERIFREKSGAYIQSVALRKQADAMLTIAAQKQVEAALAKTEDNLGAVDYVMGGVVQNLFGAGHAMDYMAEKSKENTKQVEKDAKEQAKLTEGLAEELLMQAVEIEKQFQIVSEDSTDFHEEQANKRKEILARRKKAQHDLLIANLQARAEDEKDEKTKAVTLIAIEQQKFAEMLRLDKAKKKQDRMTDEENALAVFEYQQRIDKIKEDFAQKEIERQRKVQQTINNETNDLLKSVEQLENEFFNKKTEDQKRNQEIELNAIYDKYFAQIEGLKELGQSTKILEEAQQAELEEVREKYRKIQIEKDLEVQNAKTQMALDGLKAVMDLTTAFAKDNEKSQRRAFEINKKLQIAQALIQTYQGVNAIFAARAASPESILFPAAPFIAAGIALASGLANVQNIRKQQFQGGSAGGGVNTPNFNTGGGGAGAPDILPVTNTSTLIGQEPQQVFVTETDITNTQNQVAVIETQATIK